MSRHSLVLTPLLFRSPPLTTPYLRLLQPCKPSCPLTGKPEGIIQGFDGLIVSLVITEHITSLRRPSYLGDATEDRGVASGSSRAILWHDRLRLAPRLIASLLHHT
ncbi:uncharacterized protein BO80DRAFT_111089 [Aspergillus ibericus CBS 121593]|uniref:Uncharacterized protein n=1 Tax=Aspergillus ibericus CBS 121593 TaxID=1448316 RepID=A0A395GX52_9EURO|nr:hypothetical protein BO80DRAFT_111089 [Aspergillus ibericus CBS 121593]RAK99929.1 hypothetical protein BO80DRAFT_111089 [Aspergillus ibericus CBS 121593]